MGSNGITMGPDKSGCKINQVQIINNMKTAMRYRLLYTVVTALALVLPCINVSAIMIIFLYSGPSLKAHNGDDAIS